MAASSSPSASARLLTSSRTIASCADIVATGFCRVMATSIWWLSSSRASYFAFKATCRALILRYFSFQRSEPPDLSSVFDRFFSTLCSSTEADRFFSAFGSSCEPVLRLSSAMILSPVARVLSRTGCSCVGLAQAMLRHVR